MYDVCEVAPEMSERLKTAFRRVVGALLVLMGSGAIAASQAAKPAQYYPATLPSSFGNLVWWSDDELRTLLKKRIPGLGDEIATTTAAEGRVRDALKALLREKGIQAEVQSIEPSYFGPVLDPELPPASIEFSLLSPQVMLEKILLPTDPEGVVSILESEAKEDEGRPYSAFGSWIIRSRAKTVLLQKGYLDAKIRIDRQQPHKEGARYWVSLSISIDAGPKYHVSAITADGGPLLEGRDLSPLFGMSVGDVPGREPLERLTGQLRAFYSSRGYADVDVENKAVLDHDRALVAYSVSVDAGPQYHLRSVVIQKLNADQEAKVRDFFGMKPGDLYSDEPIHGLYRKIADEPSLKGWRFGYGVNKDKAANSVDLTLEFFREDEAGRVTIK